MAKSPRTLVKVSDDERAAAFRKAAQVDPDRKAVRVISEVIKRAIEKGYN